MQDLGLGLRAADWPTERKKSGGQGHSPRQRSCCHPFRPRSASAGGIDAIRTSAGGNHLVGTSAGGNHLIGKKRPLATSWLPISAVFRRRFAIDVHLAACCEIERPAEPVSASAVDIVSLWRAFSPLYLSPLWTSGIARRTPTNMGFEAPGPRSNPQMRHFLCEQEVVRWLLVRAEPWPI